MVRLWAALIFATAGAFGPALAESSEAFRCWAGSTSFSPGAIVRAGGGVMVCNTEFRWEPTTGSASGCLWNDNFFATGAEHNDNVCQADGTWEPQEG
jgi:hypothetical protein